MDRDDLPDDRLQAFEHGRDIRDRTYKFACRVVELCKALQSAGAIARAQVPQLLASATSVAANLEEARGAESTPDFISKCCIALKECREAHVRLKVVGNCNLGPRRDVRSLLIEAGELVAILSTIVPNTKRNAEAKRNAETKMKRSKRSRIPDS